MSGDPDRPLDPRYRIEPFERSPFAEVDVLALWEREGAVRGEEARRRVQEVLLVAVTEGTGELVGVSSVYLRHNRQLTMEFWHGRVYVSEAHRLGHAGFQLAVQSYTELEQRYLAGEDTRGSGMIVVLQDEPVKQTFTKGHETWDALFIGENQRGDHIRVRYFPGVLVPPPPVVPGPPPP